MKKVKNFARFFALLRRIPCADEALKEEYVGTFTRGRTTSLREMSPAEYNAMCDAIEDKIGSDSYVSQLRRQRSVVLKRISKLGIDTSDWGSVDEFCLNKRIAGKLFVQLNIDELRALVPKLEAIARKDAARAKREQSAPEVVISPSVLSAMIQQASSQIPS